MENNRTIRWAIMGLGNIAKKFAADMALVPHSEIVAVASKTFGKAQAFASEFGITQFYPDYEAMLVAGGIDAVYIATTNETHCELTLLCFKFKVAVLCEKPLGLNMKEVQRMVRAAQKNRVFFMEAMWTYFIPAFKEVIHHVNVLKTLGEPLFVKSEFGGYFPFDENARHYNAAMGGGALLDIGIYNIAIAQAILGEPLKIQAQAQHNVITGVDEICNLQFEHRQGYSQHSSAFVAKMPIQAYVFCEQGYFYFPPRFNQPHNYVLARYDGKKPPLETSVELPYEGFGYHYEIEEVNSCLRAGLLESPTLAHQTSLAFMRTMQKVLKRTSR